MLTRIAIVSVLLSSSISTAANITIDASPAGTLQTIDGFGTCIGNEFSKEEWFQNAYYDDLGASILRVDLTPRFVSPYSDDNYVSPWFSSKPPLKIDDPATRGGPDRNNVRTYTSAADYVKPFAGRTPQIAVMTPDIAKNSKFFNYKRVTDQGRMAQAGLKRREQLGDFKLIGSIWSPAPWVKVANGQKWEGGNWPYPTKDTPFPFIWAGNFAGGKLDTTDKPLAIFNDGTGPTSALTQFARSTAAYIKGFQDTYGVNFHAISIQNEINFPEFYNSCVYRTSAEYIAALKAVRREFDKYNDLKPIQIMGPEDLLGGDFWGMWELGGGGNPSHKNLQYLAEIAKDKEAMDAVSFFCIHGYAGDGQSSAGADSKLWRWWVSGWDKAPHVALPANVKGFTAYGKKSWMTETSGEKPQWIDRDNGFPSNGAWSIAFKTQQALTTGRQSAILYWQFADKADESTNESLTRKADTTVQPKYIAAKHFFKYIRPNAVAVKTTSDDPDGVTASTYVHDVDKSVVFVLVNRAADTQPATIALPAPFDDYATYDVYTSSTDALWQSSTVKVESEKVTIDVPGYGVVTVVGKR